MRNWKEFSEKVVGISGESLLTLCDPQTNGGLLIAVDKDRLNNVIDLLKTKNHFFKQIGVLVEKQEKVVEIV